MCLNFPLLITLVVVLCSKWFINTNASFVNIELVWCERVSFSTVCQAERCKYTFNFNIKVCVLKTKRIRLMFKVKLAVKRN